MEPAKDAGRNKHFLKPVKMVPKLAWFGDNEEICQEAFRIMKEGTADEMEQYITKMTQEARQQRLEDRGVPS